MRFHLTRHRADELAALRPQPKPLDSKQTTLDNIINKLPSTSTRAKKISESVVHFVCKDLQPYSVVENGGFRHMVNTMELRYVVPTRRHITDVAVATIYEKVKIHVKILLAAAERVAQTCNA